MKQIKIIQLGNEDQCIENSIPGCHYVFGIRPLNFNRPEDRYLCSGYDVDDEDYNTNVWTVQDPFRTNFTLILKF